MSPRRPPARKGPEKRWVCRVCGARGSTWDLETTGTAEGDAHRHQLEAHQTRLTTKTRKATT